MALDGLTDNDFALFYVQPLKQFLVAIENAYFKFIDVPIDFTTKVATTIEQYEVLDASETLRNELFNNDIDFFKVLQDEQILQTLPICFVDCKDETEVHRLIRQLQHLAGFNLDYLNKEQLTYIVKHINNPGTQIPAFEVI